MTSALGRLGTSAALALLLAAPSAGGQELRGRVQRNGDGAPGVGVTLHRVTAAGSGPIARGRTDADGRFRFTVPPADTAGFTVFFATADYLGVRYFGPPLHPGDPREAYTITARDTASYRRETLPLRIARRDVVLLPDAQGGWEVNEAIRLRNPTEQTLVPRDGVTWTGRLPATATTFEMGDGEIRPDRVRRLGSQLLLTAPLQPGDHEIFFRYRVPAAAAEIPLAAGERTDELNLLVREPAPPLRVRGLTPAEPVVSEGERFLRFTGRDLPAGTSVVVAPERPLAPPVNPSLAAGGVAAAVLAVGGWFALRGRAPRAAPLGGSAGQA